MRRDIKRLLFWCILFYPTLLVGNVATFNEEINSILERNELKNANIGIEIIDAEEGKTLYSHNSEKCFLPASTVKIFTSFGALYLLGPEYRFKTEVYSNNKDLCIKGYGNPELITSDLEKIADGVIEFGITEIENLIYDASFFDEQEIGNGWVYEPGASAFNAKISALSLNKNCIDISIDGASNGTHWRLYPNTKFVEVIDSTDLQNSFTVKRVWANNKNCIILKGNDCERKWAFTRNIDAPVLYTATVFKEILEQKGIKINGSIIKGVADTSYIKIYTHLSAPLSHLVYFMNKESSNFYAEHILKTIGAETAGPPGSFEKGISEINKLLRKIEIPEEECRLVDGSGLSRYDIISPKAIAKVLSFILSQWGIKEEFLSSLPLAGVDGTLKNRLRKTDYIGKVRAKTGTMLSASAICGYANTHEDNQIIFSIMINNYTLGTSSIKAVEDEILKLIINYL